MCLGKKLIANKASIVTAYVISLVCFLYSHMCASLYYDETRWDKIEGLCSLQLAPAVFMQLACWTIMGYLLDCNGMLVGANLSRRTSNQKTTLNLET